MPSPIRLHDFLLLPWELSRGALVEDMEGLHEGVRKLQSEVFGNSGTDTTVQVHTTTATSENNFILSADTKVLIVSTTTAVFTGFNNVSNGRELLIIYKGTGTCKVSHQSSSSIINFRVICPSVNGIIVGENGMIRLVYDAEAFRWRAYTISAGKPITPTYAAGNFTAGGSQTWTVESGDIANYSYIQVNKLLTVFFYLGSTSVGGTPNSSLLIAIPNSFVSTTSTLNPVYIIDNGNRTMGYSNVTASAVTIQIVRSDAVNFTAATNATGVYGQITFEVN